MNSFTQRKNILGMENKFDFSSPPNFDNTFLVESTEDDTKQDENELVWVQWIRLLLLIVLV